MTGDSPTLLGGRYELGDLLGRGGMAEVRQARDMRLGRQVAVKRLRVDLAGDSTFQARFRREAQSAAGLNHPNIVSVYDTGEEYDAAADVSVPYIVMELVEGHTLRDILRQGRKILPERALELTQGVLDALDYSHRAGIVHRDIKPANVMLTPQGQVKVMDFGIARAVADTSATMTQTAAVIGTAQYLSPEQARGEKVDARSDIYSAGCLLYELLTGRPPFVGDSPVSVAYQHVREQPVAPSELDPMISNDIDAVVLTSLAKDPNDRYQSARDMRDDITRVLRGDEVTRVVPAPVPMPMPTSATRQIAQVGTPQSPEPPSDFQDMIDAEEEEPRSRKALWVTLSVLAALLVGALIAGAVFLWGGDKQPPAPEMVAVPSVISQTEEQAKNTLTGQGFKVQVEQVRGADDSSVGQVVDQKPTANQQAVKGSEVTITVNIGPEKQAIPDGLRGQKCAKATAQLEKLGLNVDQQQAIDEPIEANKDDLVSVSPDEGSSVAKGQRVTLTCATGQVRVPNWFGLKREVVESQAKELRLQPVFVEAGSTAEAGTVISTDPAAESKASKGSKVQVVLAKPQPTPTPSPKSEPSPTESTTGDPTERPTNDATPGRRGDRRR